MSQSRHKKRDDQGACKDFQVLSPGVIRVARCFTSPTQPYRKVKRIPDYLGMVDHTPRLKRKEYERRLAEEETRLGQLVRELEGSGRSLIVAFQGRDAAGKSGATAKIVTALDYDMKVFQAVPVGPPSDEEKRRPYFMRFFEHHRLPAFGEMRVFDRSWNEELLVVPVMELAEPEHVQNAYAEIRTMEWLLERGHAIVVKIWLDITADEQLSRFRKRQEEKPYKYKESDEVARRHWGAYTRYANEMFHRTGTTFAPWYLISSEDKRFSRVSVLEVINRELEAGLGICKP